jgi:hypothetical protein
MNFEDLTNKILNFIVNKNVESYLIISNCYNYADIDIKKIQEIIKLELNLNHYKNDIIIMIILFLDYIINI